MMGDEQSFINDFHLFLADNPALMHNHKTAFSKSTIDKDERRKRTLNKKRIKRNNKKRRRRMMTIKDFCMKHKACKEGYERAKHFKNMDDFLENSEDYADVIWACTRVMTKKERVQFSCWCFRQIWDLLKAERSKNVIIVGEKYVQGLATEEELDATANYANDAYNDAYDAANYAYHATYAEICAARKKQVEYLRNNFVFNWEG